MTAPATKLTDQIDDRCTPTDTPVSDDFCARASRDRTLPCRVADPDLWFAESPADLEAAKTLCAQCPLRAACLAAALERGEPWGVWGGEIFDQGVIIARKRPRGRPRKHPVAA
ncbi:WhiB family transcriptional regulator [Williamsia sp. CHRR-6]|uniref:WhiB family transcriptional regulator n=1 Tax=Williamsia sp. CHRR-6 TaxID=2835871 RepID=UPI001BD9BEC9|nr:WhiB family transcriptional regulator [Williamsia sp. CHRR-6]MBT0565630.1 WhiB family transcriptional regulator [Williamsia sp. CHRR-6]